ncbi:MAG: methyltransferase regulatory domain-containing protein [Alphaproteobacteria bacterium]|nr:methyltransferase regulatory domain-containing protein [Alphaproteobacteria bacterium]
MAEATLYDVFPYRSRSYVESHIDQLYTVGHLFGMKPAPVERCRVLEIGCADGGNLVPMAELLPDSEFVGIDLAERQVEDGLKWIEPLGLKNIELLHKNFKRFPAKYGNFDYIICHGVFSWIPVPEQPKLLEMIRSRLTPNGIAYVSYNTFPGWHIRRTIRDFLMQHSSGLRDPDERVAQARNLLRFLHDASSDETSYGKLVRGQCQGLLGTPPQYLLHGFTAEENHPMYFRDFVRMAAEQNLQYLGDAEFGLMMPDRLHPEGRRAMENVPGGIIEHEQVQDYLINRAFRRSLVIQQDVQLERSIPWEVVESLYMSARARLLKGEIDGVGEARFDGPDHWFQTDSPILKAGLSVLAAHWPDNMPFDEWVARTAERTERPGIEVRGMLGRNVLPMFANGVLRLHPRYLGLATEVSDRPLASPWTRRRAELFRWVTDLRHGMRNVPPVPRFVLQHCDGKNTLKDLRKKLSDEHRLGRLTVTPSIEQGLSDALEGLLERSLLRRNEL